MQVSRNSVVTIDYTLTAPDGEVLDTSTGAEPLCYVQGTESLVPGLESQLEGMKKGDRFDVHVDPDGGYGDRDEALVHQIARNQLPPGIKLEVGSQLKAESEGGDLIVTVVGLEGDRVTLDGNHPLAGMRLHFTGEIKDVRPATKDELAHGHVHGAGGYHH